MAGYNIPPNESAAYAGRCIPSPDQALGPVPEDTVPAVDPWRHRSQGMRCKTCMWFVPKEPGDPTTKFVSFDLGRCRRHAPTMGGFPVVFVNDWCGDHRLDENKV